MSERWRVIADFPDYEISDLGNLRRATDARNAKSGGIVTPKGHQLKPKRNRGGYRYVQLRLHGTSSTRRIAPLVCEAFNGPKPSPEHVCAHNDGSRDNDVATNLRWATQSENLIDCRKHGTSHGGAGPQKLSIEAARQIRQLAAAAVPKKQIARQFGIDPATVRAVVNARIWREAMETQPPY